MLILSIILLEIYSAITGDTAMSIMQKLFKRNKKSGNSVSELNTSNQPDIESKGLLSSLNNSWSFEKANDKDPSSGERKSKMKQLKHSLKMLQRQNSRLRRRQQEVMAIEAEVAQVMTLIHLAKRQIQALDEEILNKKCELTFLSEVSSEAIAESRKHEPVYHKRCSLTKNTKEATQLLDEIRDRQRIFRHLELMIYNKCLEHKHNLSGSANIKRSGAMLKNKHRHFDHLSDTMHQRRNMFGNNGTSAHAQNNSTEAKEVQCQNVTSVEITPTTTAPPNGALVTLFPTISPLFSSQSPNSHMVLMPLAPPIPNIETTI